MCVGYQTGRIIDPNRRNWEDRGPRPIAWSAWYPTDGGTGTSPPEAMFDPGDACWNATVKDGLHPVVLMSHGTGGTAESMGWLARALAAAGYVVLAPNHHGNTGLEPYAAPGFLCWWERALDMQLLLTRLAENEGPFAGHLDVSRVAAVGFSLGAYTVLALAGARTDMALFEAWCDETGTVMGGPREFPNAADQLAELKAQSTPFNAAWARQSENVRDDRIRAVVAIAPPPPVRGFVPLWVATVEVPVLLLSGGADVEAPPAQCVDWLLARNPRFEHQSLGAHAGHYSFLDLPANPALIGQVDVFCDHPDVNRATLHRQTAKLTRAACDAHLRQF